MSLQTGLDKLKEEKIIQREQVSAGHNALRNLMRSKDEIVKLLETQYSGLEAQYTEHMAGKDGRIASQSAFIDRLLAEKAAALEKAEPTEEVIKRTFGADGAKALEAASATSTEESDTYVSKCLECGDVLSSDTRQLCGKSVCHNA